MIFKRPVVLVDYPKEIKAFHMKVNEDGKTVAAADVLVPRIGEIIGGSQREHRRTPYGYVEAAMSRNGPGSSGRLVVRATNVCLQCGFRHDAVN
jgi:aspartyl/asparaginyl-tRNA synthetase